MGKQRTVTIVLKPFGVVTSIRYRFSLASSEGAHAENWIFKRLTQGVANQFQHALDYHAGAEYILYSIM